MQNVFDVFKTAHIETYIFLEKLGTIDTTPRGLFWRLSNIYMK